MTSARYVYAFDEPSEGGRELLGGKGIGLAEIRKNRSRRMGGSNHRYSKLLEVYEELEQAEAIQRKLGCPVIDTTELSIEETAARVIRLVEQRQAEAATT